jgi:predicted naringenin-chalcone synthase
MSVYIHNIETLVPSTSYKQSFIREKTKTWLNGPKKINRYIDAVYNNSRINKRHSVIADLETFYGVCKDKAGSSPTTKMRNDAFTLEAKQFYVDLARKVISASEDIERKDITHLVTVSCTGFFNPGPDYEIVKVLDLDKSVKRYNIGFMGCYAAFPGLRLAYDICRAEPEAVVLICAVELCTLHAQFEENLDSIRSEALFADGGAAVLVSAREARLDTSVFELMRFESTIIPDSEDKMAWMIGDNGFSMVLSRYIPKIIEANIREILAPIFSSQDLTVSDIDHWAVHPGGKAILDKIETSLGLKDKLKESRSILKKYGNMSSATILFVLKDILGKSCNGEKETVMSMAFGPGLTVETALMNKVKTKPKTRNKLISVRSVKS